MSIAPPPVASNAAQILSNGPLFAAIPLHPGCKIPSLNGWQLTAPGTYREEGHHGLSLQDGVLVIDFDVLRFPEGRDVHKEMHDIYLSTEPTRVVKTPKGGYHYYFKIPNGHKIAKKQSAWPGVDFLTKGAQILGAGSSTSHGQECMVPRCNKNHVEGVYQLVIDEPIADCPVVLLNLLEISAEPTQLEEAAVSLMGETDFILLCQSYPAAVEGENGDDKTYKVACKGYDLGLPQGATQAIMIEYFNPRCSPPWSDHEIKAKVKNAYRYAKNTAGSASPAAKFIAPDAPPPPPVFTSNATAAETKEDDLTSSEKVAATLGEVEYWRDSNNVAYMSKREDNNRIAHYKVKSRAFQQRLELACYKQKGSPPSEQAVKAMIRVIEAQGLHDGQEHKAWLRTAEADGKIYVDLCNDERQAVEITPSGWRVIENPPVRFIRSGSMQPLPMPEQAGPEALAELKALLNFEDDRSFILWLSFLVACFRPSGPFPICFFSGVKGSAKSTVLRVTRQLVDPTGTPDREPPKTSLDLMIAARNNHVLSFDNLSGLSPDMADAFCRISTGGSIGGRELYTNGDEVVWRAMRPIVVNGIGTLTGRGDWLDRAILPKLKPITDTMTEAEFWERFKAIRPRVMGALFSALSGAMRRLPEALKITDKPRMAEYYCLSVAAEPDLGVPVGTFAEAYTAGRHEAAEIVLDLSPIAQYLVRSLSLPWEGTSGQLLELMKSDRRVDWQQQQTLPKNPKWLSDQLSKIEKELNEVGVIVTRWRASGGARMIKIERAPMADPFAGWAI